MPNTTQIINKRLNTAKKTFTALGLAGGVILYLGLLAAGIGAAVAAVSSSKEKQDIGLKISNNGAISILFGMAVAITAYQNYSSTKILIKKSQQQLTLSDKLSISGSLLTGPSFLAFSIICFLSLNSNFKSAPAMLTSVFTFALGSMLSFTGFGIFAEPKLDESSHLLLPRSP